MKKTQEQFPPVKEQMDLLRRGAGEIISEEDLEQKLNRSRKEGRPLIIKQGFDPSAPDLHIGHAVTIRKLRQFQQLGHKVIFLIGDFTGMVGDPSGKSKTRPRLTKEDVTENAETYKKQVFKILDQADTEIRFNSEWHGNRNIYEFLDLCSKYTVARMLERDDFLNRYQAGAPISLLEFLYPLLQAYDSVALKADVEMGGSDQKFNLLLGRKIQSEFGLEPQVVFLMPILVGTDGKEKMSKSLNNYVGIYDDHAEMYGRLMSIPDECIIDYFTLATDIPTSEIERMRSEMKSGQTNPMEFKQQLGREIVTLYHDGDAAQKAEEDFITRFRRHEIPDDIPEVSLKWEESVIPIVDLLVATGSVTSRSEGRRLVEGKAVSIDGVKIDDFRYEVPLKSQQILKAGKRKIFRVVHES
ncbi:tyrosine--tRNA ligase [candidate division LCP-89 bacterium B3_LCP]|uniref:Tyrosine--tRNA ligase n=1 Tax=candidate division LCP-89 bacterium B3_LCP TaxID=2012998 RepID=A0A532UZ51_UNCL8|nr:MAG: tyrosine--tRNA ligase [candidate division LCP-89 bacterium B3_LCP]